MERSRKKSIGIAGLALGSVIAFCAGAIALLPEASPASLQPSPPVVDIALTSNSFSDARTVEVELLRPTEYEVVAPHDGRVTAIECSTGGTIVSGGSFFSLDGSPILALATDVPMWRDLVIGDIGTDVKSLQRELARLGHEVTVDGRMGHGTLSATHRALRNAGIWAQGAHIVLSQLTWIPAPSVTVNACSSKLGTSVVAGETVALASIGGHTLRVVDVPDELIEGPRVVDARGETISVNASGHSDPIAEILAARFLSDMNDHVAGDTPRVSASFRLANPIEVSTVPPSSVFALNGSHGCVRDSRKGFPVEVVGSQLGQTFVRFDAVPAPRRVLVHPDPTASCH